MQALDRFEHEMYQSAFAGRRWRYVPRAEGNLFGLAIIAIGQAGKLDIPLDSCCAADFDDIVTHAEALNAELSGGASQGAATARPVALADPSRS